VRLHFFWLYKYNYIVMLVSANLCAISISSYAALFALVGIVSHKRRTLPGRKFPDTVNLCFAQPLPFHSPAFHPFPSFPSLQYPRKRVQQINERYTQTSRFTLLLRSLKKEQLNKTRTYMYAYAYNFRDYSVTAIAKLFRSLWLNFCQRVLACRPKTRF